MNDHTNTTAANWALPAIEPDITGNRPGRGEKDLRDWRELTGRVATTATANGWTKAEVSRRSGVPDGTFSQWFSGTYQGRLDQTSMRIRQWLDSLPAIKGDQRLQVDIDPYSFL